MANSIEQLKTDVSAFSGIDESKLTGIEIQTNYFVSVINSNVNVAQYVFDGIGSGDTELTADLYYGVLVPMLSDYYTNAEKANTGAIKTITEGDSSVTYDVTAATKSATRNYNAIYSKHKKLVSI